VTFQYLFIPHALKQTERNNIYVKLTIKLLGVGILFLMREVECPFWRTNSQFVFLFNAVYSVVLQDDIARPGNLHVIQ